MDRRLRTCGGVAEPSAEPAMPQPDLASESGLSSARKGWVQSGGELLAVEAAVVIAAGAGIALVARFSPLHALQLKSQKRRQAKEHVGLREWQCCLSSSLLWPPALLLVAQLKHSSPFIPMNYAARTLPLCPWRSLCAQAELVIAAIGNEMVETAMPDAREKVGSAGASCGADEWRCTFHMPAQSTSARMLPHCAGAPDGLWL